MIRKNKDACGALTAFVVVIMAAALAALVWGAVFASEALEQRKESVRQAFHKFKEAHGNGWELIFDKNTGLPRTLSGSYYRKLPGEPEEAARSFLNENKELFLLKKELDDLRRVKVIKGPKGDLVEFQQYHKGLKVFLSGIKLAIREGSVYYVKNSYTPLSDDIDIEPTVKLEEALTVAMKDIGIEGALRGEAQGELVIYPGGDRPTLSYQLLIPSSKPLGTWLVIVDATRGEVIFKKDILRHSRGKDNKELPSD